MNVTRRPTPTKASTLQEGKEGFTLALTPTCRYDVRLMSNTHSATV